MARIVVTGQAEHHQAAERGTLHLRIAVTEDSADQAVQNAAACHAEVVGRVKTLVAQGAVTWWSAGNVVAGAFYEWHKPNPNQDAVRILRFRALADLRVRFSDFEALARFSVAVAHPEVEIGAVDWALTEARRNQIVPEVRAAAALDAVRRAQEYADGLGLGTVRLVTMYEEGLRPDVSHVSGSAVPTYSVRAGGVGGGGSPELVVQPEDITVTVTVTADFDADPV